MCYIDDSPLLHAGRCGYRSTIGALLQANVYDLHIKLQPNNSASEAVALDSYSSAADFSPLDALGYFSSGYSLDGLHPMHPWPEDFRYPHTLFFLIPTIFQ